VTFLIKTWGNHLVNGFRESEHSAVEENRLDSGSPLASPEQRKGDRAQLAPSPLLLAGGGARFALAWCTKGRRPARNMAESLRSAKGSERANNSDSLMNAWDRLGTTDLVIKYRKGLRTERTPQTALNQGFEY